MNTYFCNNNGSHPHKVGAGLLLALLVPGGLIVALVLWVTRRWNKEI